MTETIRHGRFARSAAVVTAVAVASVAFVGVEVSWAEAIPPTELEEIDAFGTRTVEEGAPHAEEAFEAAEDEAVEPRPTGAEEDPLPAPPDRSPDGAWVESDPIEAPIAFTAVGFRLPDGALLETRARTPEGWTSWMPAEQLDLADAPDPGTPEAQEAAARHRDGRRPTEPVWTGESTHLQIRVLDAVPEQVEATVIDSGGVSRTVVQRIADRLQPRLQVGDAVEAAPLPIVSRRGWGADESRRRGKVSYADEARAVVIHHTGDGDAKANSYTRAEAPQRVRSIYAYHTGALGWSDIGYNLLVDRFGTIYEGRAGGLGRAVVGAHAAPYNTGSFGVAVMGNFQHQLPAAAARTSLAEVVAWKFHVHGIQPNTTAVVNGRRINTLVGHRDVSATACPGNTWYPHMGALRNDVAARMPDAIPRHSYADVAADRYFDRPISWMADEGITDGFGNTGRFEPNLAVTRAQAVTFLWRMEGKPSVSTPHGFPDVPRDSYYEPAVRWAKANGITDGYGNTGRFEPHFDVKRGEMASFLWRSVGEPTGDPAHGFSDVGAGRHFDVPLRTLRHNGVTDGFGTTNEFRPNRPVLRGEMSALMFRTAGTPPVWRERTPPTSVLFHR